MSLRAFIEKGNVMNIKQYFSHQLAETKPHTGDYLRGRTREDVVDSIMSFEHGTHGEDTPSSEAEAQFRRSRIDHHVRAAIEEYKKRAGDRELYFMVENVKMTDAGSTAISVEIRKVWESELANFGLEQYEYVRGGDSKDNMPRFRKIVPTCEICGDTGIVQGLDFIGGSPTFESCGCKSV